LIWPREVQVGAANGKRFAHPGAGIVEEEKQPIVTCTYDGAAIRLGQDRTDLLRLKVCRWLDWRPFCGDCEDSMVLLCPPDIVAEQVLDKAVEGGETPVPCRDAVATGGFEMREKRQNRIDPNIIQTKAGHGPADMVSKEAEEQAQGVCIHSQRVRACTAHPLEMVPEVGLNEQQ
jgi:hypothetical protein